jgi:vacuolar-type H+-ATPase subunit H
VETVLEILDRTEDVLRRHLGGLPAPQRRAVEREVLGLLQMARAALPRELHQATRMLQDAEATLGRAREDARRMVLDAQAHARSLGDAPTVTASTRAQVVLEDARREAERIRRGADEYAAGVLAQLETEVGRVLATIRRGQEVLRASGDRRVE